MLVSLEKTVGLQSTDCEQSHEATEEIRLLEVEVEQLRKFPLNVLDSLADCCNA